MRSITTLSVLGISFLTLSSCVSLNDAYEDNVYATKGTAIPAGESLEDETSYNSYKYKKDQANATKYATYYENDLNRPFSNHPFIYSPYNYRGFHVHNGMYNPYNSYNPYGGYGHYNSPYNYLPMNTGYYGGYYGYGYNPYVGYGYNPYGGYGYGYNPYGNYGYNPYGNYGYGYNPYYGYGYNPYYGYGSHSNGNYYGNNFNNGSFGNNSGSTTSENYHSGPRGSAGGGNVMTRSNIPGVVKSATVPSGNTTQGNGTRAAIGATEAKNSTVKPIDNGSIITRGTATNMQNNEIRPTVSTPNGTRNSVPTRQGTVSPVRDVNTPVPSRTENTQRQNVNLTPSRTNENVSPSQYNRGNSPTNTQVPSRVERATPSNGGYSQPQQQRGGFQSGSSGTPNNGGSSGGGSRGSIGGGGSSPSGPRR